MELAGEDFELPPVNITWLDTVTDFYFEKQFSSYRVGARLGAGNYGMVKVGEDLTTHKQVAIKLIDKTSLSNIEKQNVKTEAEVMSFVSHKNIVGLYAVFENRNHICMVMEYAGGGELFDYITRQTKIHEVEARRLFVQLLEGIGYAHSKRIIHRDIKAENVFLDEKLETIKIGDWGFASVHKPGQVTESQCGTLHYAAPEILTQDPHVGPEVDVWAMGVLLYFMVCGWLPFRGSTDFDVFCKIKKGDFRALPGHISQHLKNLIETIFTVNRMTRPTVETLRQHPWCLRARDDPEYLKRPKLPRLLQLQIRQFRFKSKTPSPGLQSPVQTQVTPTHIPEIKTDHLDAPIESNTDIKQDIKRSGKSDRKRTPSKSAANTDTEKKDSEASEKRGTRKTGTKRRKRKGEGGDDGKRRRRRPRQNFEILEEDEDAMEEEPLLLRGPTSLTLSELLELPTSPHIRCSTPLEVPKGWYKKVQLEPDEITPIASTFVREDSNTSPQLPRGRRASFTIVKSSPISPLPILTRTIISTPSTEKSSHSIPISPRATLSPRKVLSPRSTLSPRSHLSPSKRTVDGRSPSRKHYTPKKRKNLDIRGSRGRITSSSFSVLRVNEEGLTNLKSMKDVELLSVEKTQDSSGEFVVLVSAITDRGQETKVLELLKQFESGASKLKRSKSLESVSHRSLFYAGDIAQSDATVTPSKCFPRRAHTPQFRRRGATWNAKDFVKFNEDAAAAAANSDKSTPPVPLQEISTIVGTFSRPFNQTSSNPDVKKFLPKPSVSVEPAKDVGRYVKISTTLSASDEGKSKANEEIKIGSKLLGSSDSEDGNKTEIIDAEIKVSSKLAVKTDRTPSPKRTERSSRGSLRVRIMVSTSPNQKRYIDEVSRDKLSPRDIEIPIGNPPTEMKD